MSLFHGTTVGSAAQILEQGFSPDHMGDVFFSGDLNYAQRVGSFKADILGDERSYAVIEADLPDEFPDETTHANIPSASVYAGTTILIRSCKVYDMGGHPVAELA